VFGRWRAWRWPWTGSAAKETTPPSADGGAHHLTLARESLRELIDDPRLPPGVRESLAGDYAAVRAMLEKLEHGHVHIAVFGRVGTGKSSLLNALIGERRFSVSPLHGETRTSRMEPWEVEAGGVFLIDTPGLDEAGGEEREALAKEVAGRADLVIFVVDGDMTESERLALRALLTRGRPVVVALNKADQYTHDELDALLASIRRKTAGLVQPDDVIAAAADPRPQAVVEIDASGAEVVLTRPRPPDVDKLRLRLWEIFEAEGKTLAAMNAGLFAADLSDQVGRRILEARRGIAERVIRTWCVAKGVAVAFNPVPVADLFAAAFIDVGMIVHLSKVYGLPVGRGEAGSLVRIIVAEAAALMGTVWALHFVSSALKVGTLGLSTILTAGAQGAIAWYSTYVVGRAAGEYLARGKSWGPGGPRRLVRDILESLDRQSVLKEARREIRARLGLSGASQA
jgi:small GTP-binding protein